MHPEVVCCDCAPRPKVAPVIVGSLVPFGVFNDGGCGCGFGFIAAPTSTPAANAIPDRPTTSRAVVKRCGE